MTIPPLTPAAQTKVGECVDDYRSALLREADFLEAQQNSGAVTREITPLIVHDANLRLRKGYARQRKSKGDIALYALTVAATFAGGIGINNVTKPWGVALFLVTFVIAVVCGSIIWVRG